MDSTQKVWIMYIIMFHLNFLTVKEQVQRDISLYGLLSYQHKGILTLKFESKDMLLWKRDSSFVSTEDENLWIASRLIWFDAPRSV